MTYIVVYTAEEIPRASEPHCKSRTTALTGSSKQLGVVIVVVDAVSLSSLTY